MDGWMDGSWLRVLTDSPLCPPAPRCCPLGLSQGPDGASCAVQGLPAGRSNSPEAEDRAQSWEGPPTPKPLAPPEPPSAEAWPEVCRGLDPALAPSLWALPSDL